jgi:hypothetical protein
MATTTQKIVNLMKYTYGAPWKKGGRTATQSIASGIAGLARMKATNPDDQGFGLNAALETGWVPEKEADWEDVRSQANAWASDPDANVSNYGKQLLSFIPASAPAVQVQNAGIDAGKTFDLTNKAQTDTLTQNAGLIGTASDKAAELVNTGITGLGKATETNNALIETQQISANDAWNKQQESIQTQLGYQVAGQKAAQEYIINGPGIWGQIKDIAEKQLNDSAADLTRIAAIARANVEQSRVAMTEQEEADFTGVIEGIEEGVKASRNRTREDMNARGMFFSTLLDSVVSVVEAEGVKQSSQGRAQHKARLGKIASDMAIMSGNIDIEMIKGNAQATAQYTATMLQYVARDAETKQTANALLAQLNAQYDAGGDNIAAIAASQVFGGRRAELGAFEAQQTANTSAYNEASAMKEYDQGVARTPFDQAIMDNQMKMNEINNMAPIERQKAINEAEAAQAKGIADAQQLATENGWKETELAIQLEKIGIGRATFDALYGKNGLEAQKLALEKTRLEIDAAYKEGQLANSARGNEIDAARLEWEQLKSSGTVIDPTAARAYRDQILQELQSPVVPISQKESLMLEYQSLNPTLQGSDFQSFLFGKPSDSKNGIIGSKGLLNIDPTEAANFIENMPNPTRALESYVLTALNKAAKEGTNIPFSTIWTAGLNGAEGISQAQAQDALRWITEITGYKPLVNEAEYSIIKNLDDTDWNGVINSVRSGKAFVPTARVDTSPQASIAKLMTSQGMTEAAATVKVLGVDALKNLPYKEVVAYYLSQGQTLSKANESAMAGRKEFGAGG